MGNNDISYTFVHLLVLDVEVNELVEESMHPLLWQLIHGEAGLASKIDYYLRQHGHPRYRPMFLLSPDSQ